MTTPHARPWPILSRNLVAILRGVTPGEVEAIGEALVEAGFQAIEVPLNSPDPFASIDRLRKRLPEEIIIGAGTVLTEAEVDSVRDAGGSLIVSPNCDPAVIARTAQLWMLSLPGVFTATEAFSALKSGASALKIFPASALGAAGIGALGAVLPKDTVIGAVGGVSDPDFATYWAAGVRAFGLGSSLYKPGFTAEDVAPRARAAVAAYDRLSHGISA